MTRLFLTLWAALVLAPPAAAQSSDASGKWDVTFTTPQGPNSVVLTLKKDGEKLTGTLSGPQGDLPVEGTQKDAAVSLSFSAQGNNGALVIAMSGTQDGDAMRGTVDYGGRAQGEWSGTRAKAVASDARAAGQTDVTGTWLFSVTTDAGSGTPTISFKQNGENLTGHYSGQFGEVDLTGTLKGNAIAFGFTVQSDAGAIRVDYSGSVERDTMKGTTRYGDLAQGTFTAKRKAAGH
jgi:hypothetical protein